MNTMQKLEILTSAARYDAACTSSGHCKSGIFATRPAAPLNYELKLLKQKLD